MNKAVASVLLRAGMAILLLAVYFYVWRPYGRTAYTHAFAVPALERVVGPTSTSASLAVAADGIRLTLTAPERSAPLRHTAPAGVRFLLPALGLLLLAPRRLYWLGLWGGHVGLGILGIALLYLGLVSGGWAFLLYEVLTRYLIDAFSLGVAALAVIHELPLAAPTEASAPA